MPVAALLRGLNERMRAHMPGLVQNNHGEAKKVYMQSSLQLLIKLFFLAAMLLL